MPTGTTTQGFTARVFIQKSCGEPWRMLGCLGITGVELFPKSLRYEVCVNGNEQVETRIIDQLADPRPYTVSWDASDVDTRNKIMSLLQRVNKGNCPFNLMLAQLDCPNPNSVGDATASDSWLVFYGNYLASSLNFGNNTYRTLDAKNATRFELQAQFAFKNQVYEGKKQYSRLATLDAAEGETDVDSIAFLDDGQCADGTCVKCGGEGCQIILAHTNLGFLISLDGGDIWAASGAAAAAGHANAYDGKLFRVDTTNSTIHVSLDGVTFTAALTDVAFASPTSIVKFDVNYYGVAGADGQFWWSTDGGANWFQVREADVAETDYLFICYNKSNDRLWAFGTNAGGTEGVVEYSDDKGVTWTPVTSEVALLDPFGRLYCADHATFAVIDHNLYVTQCDASGSATDLVQRSVTGADGEITGVGSCDPTNCNWVYLTTDDGEVFVSLDGGKTWKKESLPTSLNLTASGDINPVACCHSVDGDKLVFGFGLDLVQTKALASFFS